MLPFFSKKISFQDLPSWENLSWKNAQEALFNSLEIFSKNPSLCPSGSQKNILEIWRRFQSHPPSHEQELKSFFEKHFTPWTSQTPEEGFFTAYYEISLQGSHTFSKEYSCPLYKRPKDLLFIPDLGLYNPLLKGQKWAGKFLKDGQIHPYLNREDIMKGELQESPFLWLKDPIDAFFLHVQGFGKINLDTGKSIQIRYTASNGHPYISLRKTLLDQEKVREEDIPSKEALEEYLRTLPLYGKEGLYETLALNPSYIFFEEIQEGPPRGAFGNPEKGVSLTPLRSIAVDPLYVPLGFPVWIEAKDLPEHLGPFFPKLLFAHDIGSAIKGPKRGDIFWGSGQDAGDMAGQVKHRGDMVLFWPNEIS